MIFYCGNKYCRAKNVWWAKKNSQKTQHVERLLIHVGHNFAPTDK